PKWRGLWSRPAGTGEPATLSTQLTGLRSVATLASNRFCWPNCMATTPTKPETEIEPGVVTAGTSDARLPLWPQQRSAWPPDPIYPYETAEKNIRTSPPSGRDALQALLAFSAMHQ